MEKLVALRYVWAFGLSDKDDYVAELDRLFPENPEDDLLLKLEELDNDRTAAWARLGWLADRLNIDVFEKVYRENRFPLAEFGSRCYELWRALPYHPYQYEHIKPFSTLTYADDPLSYGDEGQSRDLYEAAFDYYKE